MPEPREPISVRNVAAWWLLLGAAIVGAQTPRDAALRVLTGDWRGVLETRAGESVWTSPVALRLEPSGAFRCDGFDEGPLHGEFDLVLDDRGRFEMILSASNAVAFRLQGLDATSETLSARLLLPTPGPVVSELRLKRGADGDRPSSRAVEAAATRPAFLAKWQARDRVDLGAARTEMERAYAASFVEAYLKDVADRDAQLRFDDGKPTLRVYSDVGAAPLGERELARLLADVVVDAGFVRTEETARPAQRGFSSIVAAHELAPKFVDSGGRPQLDDVWRVALVTLQDATRLAAEGRTHDKPAHSETDGVERRSMRTRSVWTAEEAVPGAMEGFVVGRRYQLTLTLVEVTGEGASRPAPRSYASVDVVAVYRARRPSSYTWIDVKPNGTRVAVRAADAQVCRAVAEAAAAAMCRR
ncbi:MAG TPA: hypothetical protein VEI02_09885 [Planctomycetota bacterium]|nr:hypothetical protein [Planctomycetota bacterium]